MLTLTLPQSTRRCDFTIISNSDRNYFNRAASRETDIDDTIPSVMSEESKTAGIVFVDNAIYPIS